ncbi:hypothetical protein CLV72_105340 [Allonocardiopsis opalescens]|uniref:Uncharacterized protein n=1 Tax=Allonocardiopsis opalescens TaxID=1144618 RepID=A0A2T0Q2G3_9ACTN|nr:hypothetical protein CLV72_105340 [Allonocardiopsis opalescens]
MHSLSRSALSAGATYQVWPETVPVQGLLSVYARRERSVRRSGQNSIGFAEAVSDLRDYRGSDVLIGFIDDRKRGGYYFQLFVEPAFARIVACLGVGPPRRNGAS